MQHSVSHELVFTDLTNGVTVPEKKVCVSSSYWVVSRVKLSRFVSEFVHVLMAFQRFAIGLNSNPTTGFTWELEPLAAGYNVNAAILVILSNSSM